MGSTDVGGRRFANARGGRASLHLLRDCCPELFIAAVAALFPFFVAAQPFSSSQPLKPTMYIKDPDLARFATAVGFVFSLGDEEAFLLDDVRRSNFFFISLPGAIKDLRINPDALNMFEKGLAERISRDQVDSNECWIGSFTDSSGKAFVLGINNSDNGDVDIDRRCFLASLAFFDGFAVNKIEAFNDLTTPQITAEILRRLENR